MNIGQRYTEKQARELNPLVLAYIGDAIYELYVREHLLNTLKVNAHELHKAAIKYVSAVAQSQTVEELLPLLTDEETAVYKRGRNTKSATIPKNAEVSEYRRATGLEAVLGYLYLTGNEERLKMLLGECAKRHEEK
jgi:ribonuclease-3 family protein